MSKSTTGPRAVPTHGLYVLVSKFVDLRRQGHEWRGKSPFVEKDTGTSLFVNNEQGFYRCFASNTGGNESDFIAAIAHAGVAPLLGAAAKGPVLVHAQAPAPDSLDYRRSAIMGTRPLIGEERFATILRLLIDAEVVAPAEAAAACDELACRLSMASSGEMLTNYVVAPGEANTAAAHAKSLAMEFRTTPRPDRAG